MTTLYEFKPAFQGLLKPVTKLLWRTGITANQVTLAASLLSVAAGGALLAVANCKGLLLLPPVLLVRMALNVVDGMLAREFRQQSRLGALLNELGDVISDASLYLPLAFGRGFSTLLLTLVVVLGVISEMAGVLGPFRRYDGPLGKSDRAFLFGAAALALGCGVPTGPWQNFLLIVMLVLLVATVVNRSRGALRQEGK